MSNNIIDEVCAKAFLDNQERLFDEPVAMNEAEAMEFLEDCMAQVFNSKEELEEFIEDEGIDTDEYTDITEALEVFALPDGRYLYVEA